MRVLKTKSISSPEGLAFTTLSHNDLSSKPYAILSHMWGETDSEVLYSDVINKQADSRKAFDKVKFACDQALAHGLDYLWIDTCCIDQSSSAEVSEAINSSFSWYSQAAVCYAFLDDYKGDYTSQPDGLLASRWFKRAWTLHELIAPPELIFFASGWNELGSKSHLCQDLADFTNIDPDILLGKRDVRSASCAQRFGWASKRATTRPEDIAYSLLGLFGANMVPLYGEGAEKAFLRLQREMLNDPKDSLDHSLFAWVDPGAPDDREYSLLAPSPSCFQRTNLVVPYVTPDSHPGQPTSWTSRGLHATMMLRQLDAKGTLSQCTIDCPVADLEEGTCMRIILKKTGHDQYARVKASHIGRSKPQDYYGLAQYGNDFSSSTNVSMRQIYIRESPRRVEREIDQIYPYHYISLEASLPGSMYRISEVTLMPIGNKLPFLSKSGGEVFRQQVMRRAGGKVTAVVLLTRWDGKRLVVSLGTAAALQLGFDAQELDEDREGGSSGKGGGEHPTTQHVTSTFSPRPLGGSAMRLANHRVTMELTDTEIVAGKHHKHYKVRMLVVPGEQQDTTIATVPAVAPPFPDEPPPEFTEKPTGKDADEGSGAKGEKGEKGESSRSKLRSFLGRN